MMRSPTEAVREGFEETFDNEILKHLMGDDRKQSYTNICRTELKSIEDLQAFVYAERNPFRVGSEQKKEPQVLPKHHQQNSTD